MQVHPDIEKFVDTQARHVIHTKTIRFQVFSGDVEIAFKRRDAPAQRPFRQQSACVFVSDPYIFHQLARGTAKPPMAHTRK